MNRLPCPREGVPPVPSEAFLELFVTHCARNLKLGYSTIKLYLSAIRHHYIVQGYGDLFVGMARLKLTLSGIRRVHSTPKRNRIPLTATMLHSLGYQLREGVKGQFEDALLWAAMCVGFFGALRCAEFTGQDSLCIGDALFKHDSNLDKHYVSLHLRVSKTDPYRQGCTVFLFATDHFMCPYMSLQRYLNLRCIKSQEEALFCHQNGDVMTRNSFLHLLQLGLQAANVSTDGISGHSLRKGFATSAVAVNVQDNLISTMGRWASDCYKLYISTPLSSIANAQSAIAAQKKEHPV